jgi:hypothetical protein
MFRKANGNNTKKICRNFLGIVQVVTSHLKLILGFFFFFFAFFAISVIVSYFFFFCKMLKFIPRKCSDLMPSHVKTVYQVKTVFPFLSLLHPLYSTVETVKKMQKLNFENVKNNFRSWAREHFKWLMSKLHNGKSSEL